MAWRGVAWEPVDPCRYLRLKDKRRSFAWAASITQGDYPISGGLIVLLKESEVTYCAWSYGARGRERGPRVLVHDGTVWERTFCCCCCCSRQQGSRDSHRHGLSVLQVHLYPRSQLEVPRTDGTLGKGVAEWGERGRDFG